MTEKVAEKSLTSGDHGTTYGGNPLATCAINKVLDLFEESNIIENVREITPYFEEKLDEIMVKYDCILTRRGAGLMQGLVFDKPVGAIINKAIEKGLLLINAGTNIIRFLPSLIITKKDIDDMIVLLDEAIKETI